MDTPELVIHPSATNQPFVLVLYPLVVIVWLGCVYLVTHPLLLGASSFATQRLLFGLYAAVVAIPVGIIIGIVSTRTASIYLTASHIGHTGFSRVPIEHKRSDLARITLFSECRYKGAYTPDGVQIAVIAFESIHGGEWPTYGAWLWRAVYRWRGVGRIYAISNDC